MRIKADKFVHMGENSEGSICNCNVSVVSYI